MSKPRDNATVKQRQVRAAARRLEWASRRVSSAPTSAIAIWYAAREAQEAALYLRKALQP